MSVKKVTEHGLFFECSASVSNNGNSAKCGNVAEVPFDQIVVVVKNDICFLQLPSCPKCGGRSCVVPGKDEDGPRHHIRRIAWKRSVAAGNFKNDMSRTVAIGRTKDFDAFYNAKGREALKALYVDNSSTVEILKKESK